MAVASRSSAKLFWKKLTKGGKSDTAVWTVSTNVYICMRKEG